MITVPSLNDTSDILDTDMVMVTHSDGSTEKISGADLNMRNKVIFSANKTLTGTPLKAGNVVRVCFTQDITGLDTSSVLQLEYNEVDKNVKVNKDGTLIDFVATEISSGIYKYVQAYTVLELLYDGTQFIIIGNPVVISDDGLKYYADGSKLVDTVAVDNMNSVTSNAVAARFNLLAYSSTEIKTGLKWIDGKDRYVKVVSIGSLPNADTKNVNHGISNLYEVIRFQGLAHNSARNDFIPVPWVDKYASAQYNVFLRVTATQISIATDGYMSTYSGYVILEYTKTTD